MKKIFLIFSLAIGIGLISCNDVQRKPSKVYMPDMAYSRGYETYAERDSLFTTEVSSRGSKIFYNNKPAVGTIARGSEMPFSLSQDALGDTTHYFASKAIKSPIDTMTVAQLEESGRLYLINCGICHGTKLDGNGPLYKGGEGPYAAKPATLVGDAKYEAMPEGQMFYSIQYGKGQMGSYASQLSRKQRWEIVAYIKHMQKKSKSAAAPAEEATAKK